MILMDISISKKALFFYLMFLILTFISCYYYTFGWLNYKYSLKDSYYSHGYLIPLISGYLIYSMWEKIVPIKTESNYWGLLIFIFAITMHLIAVIGDINFISGFSILFYLFGCSLFLLGKEITKCLAFPLFFLVFMFPVPDMFINVIGLPTKSLATVIGLKIVSLFDIPYLREGFRIHLANSTMTVGTECNGMKSLLAFLALGILAIYITRFDIKKSLLAIVGIYPLAVLLNGCRIAILVIIAEWYGIEKAAPESFLHDLSGIVVFIIGIIILFLPIKLFESSKT